MPNQPKTKGRTVRVDDETWAAVEAEAKRSGVKASDVVRKALRQMLGTLPVLLALVALFAWGGREVSLNQYDCNASWCADRAAYEQAQLQDIIVAQLDQRIAKGDCTTTARLSKTMLVTTTVGRLGDDLGVVREVSWDEGFRLAQARKVWVHAYCG